MATHVRVDDAGIHLPPGIDEPVDIRFGGHRLWSFNPTRDGKRTVTGLTVAWPGAIKERLAGTAEVSVEKHLTGEALFSESVRFADSSEPLEFRDDAGNPVTLDKGGRFQRSFDRMDADAVNLLVDASKRVLEDLVDKCGLDAYLAYGGLLGAVRTGHMIGHDSDVDLAYLSKYTHPFDIIRECRAAEQQMKDLGWQVVRMSAANFKVWVPLPNGKRAGVDVFGSFHIGEHFHITGSLRGKLARDKILPFEPIALEGIEFPAPRDLNAFLTYTYGPGWQVPDPAFHFDHPPENTEMMSQWWRGSRSRLWHWSAFYRSDVKVAKIPTEPSRFAQWVVGRIDADAQIVELGSGTGRDAVWLAEQGFKVIASDYCGAARTLTEANAKARGVKVPVRGYNVEAIQNYLTMGAKLAHRPGTKHIYARLFLDSIAPRGRDGFWRFASMVCRSGGHTFIEFRTARNRGGPFFFGNHIRTLPKVEVIEAEIARYGGTIVHQEIGRDLAPLGNENPYVCRLEVSWT